MYVFLARASATLSPRTVRRERLAEARATIQFGSNCDCRTSIFSRTRQFAEVHVPDRRERIEARPQANSAATAPVRREERPKKLTEMQQLEKDTKHIFENKVDAFVPYHLSTGAYAPEVPTLEGDTAMIGRPAGYLVTSKIKQPIFCLKTYP